MSTIITANRPQTVSQKLEDWMNERSIYFQKPHPNRHRLFLNDPAFKREDLADADNYMEFAVKCASKRLEKIVKVVRKQYPKRIAYVENNSLAPKLYRVPRPFPRDRELRAELVNMEMNSRKERIAWFAWKRAFVEREEARLWREISWCQDS